jgi:hypothetical protein
VEETEKTKTAGITRHATTMKINQIFSHFQRGSSFIGVVNRPLNSPDSMTSAIPVITIRGSGERQSPKTS